ncbi:MAG: CAP domain-containing protein [Candidatus Eremiobacterota bacterium]
MRRYLQSSMCALVVLLAILSAGCGGGGGGNAANPANPANPNPQTATVQVNHVLARTVPATVDTFRFSGPDSNGTVVFGPQDVAKSAQVNLTVPVTMVALNIQYLSGGTVVGTYSQGTTLTAGGTLAINDPAWTDSGGPSPGGPALNHLNQLRALAGLSPLSENAGLTSACTAHATYMVKNNVIGHTEDPNLPFYTPAGDQAGQKSNVVGTSVFNQSANDLIDSLMTSPFHGVGFIDPRLQQTGIGYYTEQDGGVQSAAAVDVLSALDVNPHPPYPVLWPGNGATVGLRTYPGNEYPDPLTGLPGFSAPTGLPIYALFDPNTPVSVTAFSVQEVGGGALVVGEIDGTNYTNPDGVAQTLARTILTNRGAVVLLPQSPLTAGRSYQCSLTNNGVTTNWTFTVDANAPRQGGDAPPPSIR